MPVLELNRRWARIIIESLTRNGITHVCIAPGSRSTPLTLEAAANPKLVCHTHFDERGLGFYALGMAKSTMQPVAVIVTSGTAVTNLLPAAVEARLTGARLVYLTGDRPLALQDCGANQAIGNQDRIFEAVAADVISFPRPNAEVPARWLTSRIDDALSRLKGGLLHINCPFVEPLYGDVSERHAHDGWAMGLGDWWNDNKPWLRYSAGYQQLRTEPDWDEWKNRRGVVVAGRLPFGEGKVVAEWARALDWPLVSDVLSQTGTPMPYADICLSHPDLQYAIADTEFVVQFGRRLTGKRVLDWQAVCQPAEYWLVDPLEGRLDPALHRGRRIVGHASDWIAAHSPARKKGDTEWHDYWHPLISRLVGLAREMIEREIDQKTLSEPLVAHRMPELAPAGCQLFIGNSLMIRLIDALAQLPATLPVYANRGASGIDGLVATACGVAVGNNTPTLVVLGDTSLLHDLNSLSLLRRVKTPMVVLVVNNDGGGIFSMLPTPEAERDRFYRMPHGLTFKQAAAMFELNYAAPTTWSKLHDTVHQSFRDGKRTLVEVIVPPSQGAEMFNNLLKKFQHS